MFSSIDHGLALVWDTGMPAWVITALEVAVELGNSLWGDNLDVFEGVECKLETNLVVTLTSAAVGNSNTVLSKIWAREMTGRAREVPGVRLVDDCYVICKG